MKLRTTVAGFAPDEDDQRWIEPRLAALIGLADMPPGDRSELYAALRTFFQRISEQGTVLMVFEDLHWADEGLLDFIEELVERSTSSPILVLTLARPELMDRRSDWGASRRRSLLMHLSRLDEGAMRDLVAGLAPGIPDDLVRRIAGRTAGVPLHAVEFVRMLVNSGQLKAVDGHFEFVGEPGDLAIPDTVSAIISARLDRLTPEEAALIQDASVLGLSFTLGGIAGVAKKSPEQIEATLRALVRRDVLELDESPRSPERGQYRFVQSLIREVAYGRLPKADRVSRHLEIARLTEEQNDPELAAVIASHYASAAEADPSNLDLVAQARKAIIASADRAAALHSDVQAAALYRRAIDLAADAAERAKLNLALTKCLDLSGREDLAFEVGNEALAYYREVDDVRGIAEAATCIADTLSSNFDTARAAEIILPVYESTPQVDDKYWARLASQTSRALALSDHAESAIEVADRAAPILERMDMIEDLLETLNNKALSLARLRRVTESAALLTGVAAVAAEHGLLRSEIRAVNNLIASSQLDNQREEAFPDIYPLIDRSGNLAWKIRALFFSSYGAFEKGDLNGAFAHLDEGETYDLSELWSTAYESLRLQFELFRDGRDPAKVERIDEIAELYIASGDPQLISTGHSTKVTAKYLAGDYGAGAAYGAANEPDPTGYPDAYQLAIQCAALAADAESARSLEVQLREADYKGRAIDGLRELAGMVVAGLEGDLESTVGKHQKVASLWENTMTPLDLVQLNAITALLLPGDNTVGAEAARAAEGFAREKGFGYMLEVYSDTLTRYSSDPGELAV